MGFPNVIIQSFACYVNTKVTEKIHKKFANVLTEYRFHYIISKLENALSSKKEGRKVDLNCGIDIGDVVLSIAGRDKNEYFIITKVEKNYVYLVDGDIRKIENPKKKKMKHVELTDFSDSTIAERIRNNNKITNQDIRKSLKNSIK